MMPTWFSEARQDLRYAARTLVRSRSFTAASAGTLALAIGATTTMFSVLNTVLLRPLPYRAPEQLVMLWTEDPTQNLREGRSALWNVDQWRSQSQSLADVAVFDATSTTLTARDGAEQIAGASMSPNLLALLGVQPVRGRSIPGDGADQSHQVLISHRFWQTHFGGSDAAIGATLVLNGVPVEIAGVLPAGFQVAALSADVWQMQAMTRDRGAGERVRGPETWFVIGRLRPGVTLERAQAELGTIARRVNEQMPAAERNRGISLVPLTLQMVGSQSRLALWVLGGAVLCVFLIAAANVAGLLLARGIGRAREMAVRAALGATAGRIVRQLVTESLLLAAVAGVIGALLASWGIPLVRALGPGNLARLDEVTLDGRALGWALAISIAAGVLVGLAPAIAALRRDVRATANAGGRSASGGGLARTIRGALVVAEFALAIVVLTGAGLLLRSWWSVKGIDPGYRPARVLMMELSAPPALDAAVQRADLYRRVLEEIQSLPGVESAGIVGDLFIGNSREQLITIEGDGGASSERVRFARDEASADFFKTLGTPLRSGRFFSIGDTPDAAPVAIVNEAMARRSWPGRDPVGRRFRLGPAGSDRPWYTVVGVVGNMRRQGLEREPLPQVFVSLAQNAPRSVDLFIRTSSDDPSTMAAALREAVHRIDKAVPVYGTAPLEDRLGTYLAQRRFQTSLLGGFAGVALLLAAVGIYGLIQYSMATRTQEIGLRIAIGADRRDIFRMMIGEGLRLSLAGLAIGLAGSWWMGRALSSLLFGVTASDPWTFIAVSLLLTAAAAAACYVPARRATGIDPIVALRVG